MTIAIARVHTVHLIMQTEHWVAANPQTKPTDLGSESADKWLLPSTSSIAMPFVIITQPESRHSFYCPMEGGRHYRKGVQPVPKT